MGTLGWLGFRSVDNVVGATLIAVAVVVLVGALWGLLLSPRRRIDLPLGARVAIELALFGIASGGLAMAGLPLAGIALFTLEVVVVSGLAALGYPRAATSVAVVPRDSRRRRGSPARGDNSGSRW